MEFPSAYDVMQFQEALSDIVSRALGLGDPIFGGIEATSLYSVDLQVSAAIAASNLDIEPQLAVAYLIYAEAVRYEGTINKLTLVTSKEKRRLYAKHRKLVEFIVPIVKEAPDNEQSDKFLEHVVQNLAQVRNGMRA